MNPNTTSLKPSRVAQMVCPLCSRMHGREHVEGCPEGEKHSADYRDGWIRARNSLLPLFDRIRELQMSREKPYEDELRRLLAEQLADQMKTRR